MPECLHATAIGKLGLDSLTTWSTNLKARARRQRMSPELCIRRRGSIRNLGCVPRAGQRFQGHSEPRESGMRNENVAPSPSSLSTQMSPPNRCRICLLIGKPRPVPCGLSVRVLPACWNRSKIFAWSFLAMPTPLSLTSCGGIHPPAELRARRGHPVWNRISRHWR